MSSILDAPTISQLRPVLENADIAFFISCAATALVFYEHAITIGLEVQQIWRRDISGATILFVLTRYITLVNRIFVIIGLTSLHSLESCSAISWLQVSTTSLLSIVMSAIAAVRVYALWDRDIRLFSVIMVMGLFPALTNLFFRGASMVVLIPTHLFTCQSAPVAMSASVYEALLLATRIIAIVSDGLTVVLTWMKTYRVFMLTRKIEFRTNYSVLILRDGTLYFLAVCVLNLVAIIYITDVGANVLNDIIVTLSSLLMARFLLNLRDQRTRNETISFEFTSSTGALTTRPVSSVDFARSMGGRVGADDDGEVHVYTEEELFDIVSATTRVSCAKHVSFCLPATGDEKADWV